MCKLFWYLETFHSSSFHKVEGLSMRGAIWAKPSPPSSAGREERGQKFNYNLFWQDTFWGISIQASMKRPWSYWLCGFFWLKLCLTINYILVNSITDRNPFNHGCSLYLILLPGSMSVSLFLWQENKRAGNLMVGGSCTLIVGNLMVERRVAYSIWRSHHQTRAGKFWAQMLTASQRASLRSWQ